MADFHQMVVDDVGKVVCRQVIGTLVEHFVIEYVRVYCHFAANQVVDFNIASRINQEPYDIWCAFGNQFFNLLFGHRQ